MNFTSSLLVAVSLTVVNAEGEEGARLFGDKNRIEQEFWELWGQKGVHRWGDLTKWNDKERYGYCSAYYRKVIGYRVPTLQFVPELKPALISVRFQSPLSKQMGFYGRKIRNVQVIHCPMTKLQFRNPNKRLEHVYDFYLTKKSKKDNCLIEILPQIDVRTFERVRQIKTYYYLASEICWPLVKRRISGDLIRRTKSDSEELYKNLPSRPELSKEQSGAENEEVNVPVAIQSYAQEAVPEFQVDDQPHEVEQSEKSAHQNKEETEEHLNRDENETTGSSLQVRHLDEHMSEEPEHSHARIAEDESRLRRDDQQIAFSYPTVVGNENAMSEHNDNHMHEPANSTSTVGEKQNIPYNSEFQTPTSLMKEELKMDTEKAESIHNDDLLDKSDNPTSTMAEKHSNDNEPNSPTFTIAEKLSSDIEPDFPTSIMKVELKIDTAKADSVHNQVHMDIPAITVSPVGDKQNSTFASDKQPGLPTSLMGEKPTWGYNSGNEPSMSKSPTEQNKVLKHISGREYASPTGENIVVVTKKKDHQFLSEEEPHFSPNLFGTYDDNTDVELENKVYQYPSDNEPHFPPDEFGTFDDVSYHELEDI